MKPGRLEGRRFGSLTVIRKVARAADRHVVYEVRCDCGAIRQARSNNVQKVCKSGRRQCHYGSA